MTINDPIFGELDYNYGWIRHTTIDFCERDFEIALMISGEEDGKFDEEQYEAYKIFMQNWNEIQKNILQPILDYYKQTRHDLGYDVSNNENYPLIETIDQLLENINLVGISVPYAECFEGRDIRLSFDCTWDMENGLGLRLINEKVDEVGYQDVAF